MSIRNVRNFWIDCDIDGRESTLSGGPRSKTDGMSINIKQRDDGCVTNALRIDCFVSSENELITRVFNANGEKLAEITTKR